MQKTLTNLFLGLPTIWLGLLDYCLIATANASLSGDIVVLLVLQASIIAFAFVLANGGFPNLRELASGDGSARLKGIAIAVPTLFLMFSPFLISDSIYRARYGSGNRITVQAYVVHDLGCCLNPLSVFRR